MWFCGVVQVKGKGRMETYTLTLPAMAPRTATSGCGAAGSDLRRQPAASSQARGDPPVLWSPQHLSSNDRARRASVANFSAAPKSGPLMLSGLPSRGSQTKNRRASAIADCAVAAFGSGLSASSSFAGGKGCEELQPVDVGSLVREAGCRGGGQGAEGAAAGPGAGEEAGPEVEAGGALSGPGTGQDNWWNTSAAAHERPSGTILVERVAESGALAGEAAARGAGLGGGSGGAGPHLPAAVMQEWAHASVGVRDQPAQHAGLGGCLGGVATGHVARPVRRSRSSGTLGA